MYKIAGYEWIIYMLSLLSVMLLGTLTGNASKGKFNAKADSVKKVCLGVFILTSMYWIITFPYVSSYYNFSDKSDYPSEISAEKQLEYNIENHRRIQNLESELKQTKDELYSIRGRIDLFLQIIMYGLIFFGSNRIFNSNNREPKEVRLDQNFKL